jgi:hypothetical protein
MAHTLHDVGLTCPGAPGLSFVGVALGAVRLATSLILIASGMACERGRSMISKGRKASSAVMLGCACGRSKPARLLSIRCKTTKSAPWRTMGTSMCSLPRAVGHSPLTPSIAVKAIGVRAALPFPVHAHILPHTCSYMLAGKGHRKRRTQERLGHVSITHTAKYTALATDRFKDFLAELTARTLRGAPFALPVTPRGPLARPSRIVRGERVVAARLRGNVTLREHRARGERE